MLKNELVLASVTAILKFQLENGLVEHGVTASVGSDVFISALPPDRVETGAEERAQLNLFLYQIIPKGLSSSSRYADKPGPAVNNMTPPSLVLDLHYLLTAYGAQDLDTEILLGFGMEQFQTLSSLTGAAIQKILTALSSPQDRRLVPPALAALTASGVVQRFEQIKVCPQSLELEELSKLWSALQARYRPYATYKVTVTLSDAERQAP